MDCYRVIKQSNNIKAGLIPAFFIPATNHLVVFLDTENFRVIIRYTVCINIINRRHKEDLNMNKHQVEQAIKLMKEMKTNAYVKQKTGLPHVNVSVIKQLIRIGVL